MQNLYSFLNNLHFECILYAVTNSVKENVGNDHHNTKHENCQIQHNLN